MFIRVWNYRVNRSETARFEQFEREYGVPMVKAQPGCLAVEFFRRITDNSDGLQNDQTEYTMISKWAEQSHLDSAVASPEWREEIKLFQSQNFSNRPGDTRHYEQID